MPIYEYEHQGRPCRLGRSFDHRQSLSEPALERCPVCGGAVAKILSRINIRTPKSNRELRELGFTKLVRRDDGVYENVTARPGESRVMERGKPGSIPDFRRTIGD